MAIALLRLVQYFSGPCLGIISVLANAADDIPIIHVALLNGISKKYYAQSLSIMKQGQLRCHDAIIWITGRAACSHRRMINMFADYVSMSLRRTARRFASPAIPTAEMPINAAERFLFREGREQIMLRKYVFGARFYVSDMFKCGSCGYATRIRVLGDTCTCPRCGATMRRL